VGGFILHQLGELPEKGEEVIWGGLRFIVTDVEERRLLEVSVSPTTEAEAR
jgi:CBS domain containing-hemolysin-like protein